MPRPGPSAAGGCPYTPVSPSDSRGTKGTKGHGGCESSESLSQLHNAYDNIHTNKGFRFVCVLLLFDMDHSSGLKPPRRIRNRWQTEMLVKPRFIVIKLECSHAERQLENKDDLIRVKQPAGGSCCQHIHPLFPLTHLEHQLEGRVELKGQHRNNGACWEQFHGGTTFFLCHSEEEA